MLKRKLLRDILKNKTQFLTIFLMVFIGIFIYSGISSYMMGMRKSVDKYYKESNLQDLWVNGYDLESQDLKKIKQEKYVKDAEIKTTVLGQMKHKEERTLQVNFITSNKISKFYVQKGKKFDYNQKGIWMDCTYAVNNKIKIGDTITITFQDRKIKEKVVGLIMTPDHVYDVKSESELFPNHIDYGFVYLSSKDQKDLVPTEIMVSLKDKKYAEQVKKSITKLKNVTYVSTRDENISVKRYESEIEEGKTYVGVFSGIFLVIAILSVITTMSRVVKKERVQIGILKALGFKTKKITRLYISYGFFISLIGAVFGLFIGPLLLGNFFLYINMDYFQVPNYRIYFDLVSILVCIIMVLIITIVTYLTCKNELKEKASEILRIKEPSIKKTRFDFNRGISKKFRFSTKWNLRDIFRNKMRSIMAITGIAGCTMLIVCAFGLLNSMDNFINWQFDKLYNFEFRMDLKKDIKKEEYKKIVDKYGPNSSRNMLVEVKGHKEAVPFFIDDANNLIRYTDSHNKYMKLKDNGIYITQKEANTLSVKKGDTISLKFVGEEKTYNMKVIGINRDPQTQGFSATKKYISSLDRSYQPDTLYTNRDLTLVEKLDGVELIQSRNTIRQSMMGMVESLRMMVIIIIFAAVVLGVVIIYNLGILSFTEKTYQFATLKVLGFNNNRIGKIFIKQNIWLTMIAIIIGAPLGYVMTNFIFTMALGDTFDFKAHITIYSYLYGILGTFFVSWFVNKRLSNMVRKIDMVTSLKGNE